MIERLARIETTLQQSSKTDEIAVSADSRSKENERRLNKLEESHTWLWRTVGASVITGAVAVIVDFATRIH